jgi:hypothetical protein
MFSEYCDAPFEVEAAEVVTSSGETVHYPSLAYRTETVLKNKINKLVGKFVDTSVVTHFSKSVNSDVLFAGLFC